MWPFSLCCGSQLCSDGVVGFRSPLHKCDLDFHIPAKTFFLRSYSYCTEVKTRSFLCVCWGDSSAYNTLGKISVTAETILCHLQSKQDEKDGSRKWTAGTPDSLWKQVLIIKVLITFVSASNWHLPPSTTSQQTPTDCIPVSELGGFKWRALSLSSRRCFWGNISFAILNVCLR